MNDKTKLIESMTNLIHHVSASRKNQQQIFATLSLTDIKKILTNLQDSNQKLRKTTLMLLAELLYENIGLQRKFCQITSIPQYTGKVVFTCNFPKAILCDVQSIGEVFKALKDESNAKQRGLFWYIDSQSKPKIIQVGKRNSWVDPLNCIVGVWIINEVNQNINNQQSKNNITPIKNFQQVDMLSPKRFDFKNINPLNGKVRLNRSQQLQKSAQFMFKPQTPMKSSMNEEKVGSITAPRPKQFWINSPPTQPKSQIKSYGPVQINKSLTTTQRKNSQPLNSQFDNLKYIRTNNYVNQVITPINSMSTVNTLNTTTNVTFTNNRFDQINMFQGPPQNKMNGFYSQNMRQIRPQFRKNQ